MKQPVFSRGWVGVLAVMAAGFVAWGAVLVFRLSEEHRDTLAKGPVLQQLAVAREEVDRTVLQSPLLTDRELSARLRSGEWSRRILDLYPVRSSLPSLDSHSAQFGWEHLQARVDEIERINARLAAAIGPQERERERRALDAELAQLADQLRLMQQSLDAELWDLMRRSMETNRKLAVVVGLSSFAAAALMIVFLMYRRDYRRLTEAERALQRSEERLLGILGGMQDVVWSVTPDARIITYVSPAARSLFGLEPTAILKNPSLYQEHVHPEDRAAVRDFPDKLRDSPKGTLEMEYRYRHPDGRRLWIQDRGWTVLGEDGSIRSLVAISKDVTSRKNAEDALQASEAQYRRIVESTADGIAVVDTTDRIVFANPGLEEIFGTGKGELAERSLHEFIEEQHALLIHPREDPGRFDATNQFEVEVLRADGKKRQVRVTVSPVYDDTGAFTGTLGIYRDSTELIEAQITLIRELAFLSEIEVLGRSIVGQSDIRQIVFDACGAAVAYGGVENAVIVFRNPNTGMLSENSSTFPSGAQPSALISVLQREEGIAGEVQSQRGEMAFGDLEASDAHGALRPLVHLGFRALIALPIRAGGKTFGILYGLDRKTRKYDSEEVSRLRHLTILLGSALSNVSLYVRTEAANKELKAAVDRLQEAERARDQFYRFLIHDLNKPLAAIIGTAGRLQLHAELPEKLGSRIERIENAALRLRDIVDHLLQHEQVRREDFELKRERLSVWDNVLDAIRMLDEKRRSIAITVNGLPLGEASELPEFVVDADSTAFRRILNNLIDNALEHAATSIKVDVATRDDGLSISVWNDGSTILDEERDSIFREFFRGSGNRRSGYGLGLASVKRLMQLHGGTIELQNTEPDGVTFSLFFPLSGTRNGD
ncbi:MAG: hypothetical protein PWP23_1424 [Candidatus Sumerlaeota bacterium]|nr:hypothetical protein [Candidatus Sumerlaeota bacterium]